MATTSRGLRYPVGTDPVAIHTDLQNLATDVDGKLNVSLATTKGDLITHNGSQEIILGAGSNGSLLRADSSTASGLAWDTSLVTDSSVNAKITRYDGNGTDTSVLFSSIPQTYSDLELVGRLGFVGAASTGNTLVKIIVNGEELKFDSVLQSTALTREAEITAGLRFAVARVGTEHDPLDGNIIRIRISDYTSTTKRANVFATMVTMEGTSAANTNGTIAVGTVPTTGAVTSIEIKEEASNAIANKSFIEMFGNFGG
jgi:hypothetical protein